MHQEHQQLIQALNDCVAACEHCISSCLQEDDVKMMVRCISLDRDCSDICALTVRFLARGSEHAQHLLRECAEVCHACAEECAQHDDQHCQDCAAACRLCEEACRQAMTAA